MSKHIVNLAEIRAHCEEATMPVVTDCAKFKAANPKDVSRVIADSERFVIYSLKNASDLRVLVKTQQPATQLSFKKHTNAVTAAKFVALRSNIVASTSVSELIVWFVGKDDTQVYFTLPVSCSAFTWVPVQGRAPDMLVLTDTAEGKRASILKSGQLISEATDAKTEDGLIPNVADSLTTVSNSPTSKAKFVCASSPILAFAIDEKSIVTCTRANFNTPPWCPTNEEPLIDLAMPQGPLLIAASAQGFTTWDVAAEPKPLQTIRCGSESVSCANMIATPGRLTALVQISQNIDGSVPSWELAVLRIQDGIYITGVSFYRNPDQSNPALPIGIAPSPCPEDEPTLLTDFNTGLSWLTLKNAPWNDIDSHTTEGRKRREKPHRSPASKPSPPPYAGSNTMEPSVVAAMQHLQALQTMQHVTVGNAALKNSSLPPSMDAGTQRFVDASASNLSASASEVEKALSNTTQMMDLVPTMVKQDHEALVKTALEAQRDAIAQAIKQGGFAGNTTSASAAAGDEYAVADAVLQGLVPQLAGTVVETITQSVEETVKANLENTIRSAISKQIKRGFKANSNDYKEKVDTLAKEIMQGVSEEFSRKQSQYSNKLIHYISDMTAESMQAVLQLQQTVQQQSDVINSFAKSGVLEEVKRLRAEVAQLKAAAAAGSRPAVSQPPQEEMSVDTIVSNAKRFFAGDSPALGLQWVLNLNNPDLTYELLGSCDQDTWDSVVADKNISIDLWCRTVGDLTAKPKSERLIPTLEWLCDIIGEHPDLKKVGGTTETLTAFLGVWKTQQVSNESKDLLRQLMVLLRR